MFYYYKVTFTCNTTGDNLHERVVMAKNETLAIETCAGSVYQTFYENFLDCSVNYRFNPVEGFYELYIYIDDELLLACLNFKAELIQDESEVI